MKKILIGMVLVLSSFFAQAAPTDCRQLVEDGEVDCIKATSWFQYAISNAPLTRTFEETVAAYEANVNICKNYKNAVCYTQYEGTPDEPPAGKSADWSAIKINENMPNTAVKYNYSHNDAGRIVTTYYYPNLNTYSKHSAVVYHFRVCPENTTAINAGLDTYLRYCKPNPIPQNNPTSCDTGCNASSGNVSIGN